MHRYHSKAFPPYRYTPGENPHPVISPDGHSYQMPETEIKFDPSAWQNSEQFLYGVDLINADFYWEAHEVFEGIWHTLARASHDGCMIQACILIAVSALHQRRGRFSTAAKVARNGLGKLNGLNGEKFGISIDELRKCFEDCVQEKPIQPIIKLNGL